MPAPINEDQEQVLYDLFLDLYLADKDSKAPNDSIRLALCHIGQNPTKQQLEDTTDIVDPDKNGEFTVFDFVELLKSPDSLKEKDEIFTELRESFNKFVKEETGELDVEGLKQALVSSGQEPLSEDEIAELLDVLNIEHQSSIPNDEIPNLTRRLYASEEEQPQEPDAAADGEQSQEPDAAADGEQSQEPDAAADVDQSQEPYETGYAAPELEAY